jgi:signal transduction histidine kinase
MNVEQLYPPGVARQVMRKIRGHAHGGANRLVDYQVEMQDCEGKPIPTKLSAALIYEDNSPVGSVGIFTDIRGQLEMAERLRGAEQELRRQEKDVAVAQLAGATAHELNQPLTSVIAYAELLIRRSKSDPALLDAANVIVDQAERMAEIVRRVGALTRYETKSYVGTSQIVDLNKSTDGD